MKRPKTTLLSTPALALAAALLIAPHAMAADDKSTNATATQPDNTARNERDRDPKALTPLDQGNSKADVDTTAQIRREIVGTKGLSVNAQNVKIITNNGHVTLRGPVDSAGEKRIVGEIAARIAPSKHADNQVEVRSAAPAN